MFKGFFKRRKHRYWMQLGERSSLAASAYSEYEAAELMWKMMSPTPSQAYPNGRGPFGSFDVFWEIASKPYGIIDMGQVDD